MIPFDLLLRRISLFTPSRVTSIPEVSEKNTKNWLEEKPTARRKRKAHPAVWRLCFLCATDYYVYMNNTAPYRANYFVESSYARWNGEYQIHDFICHGIPNGGLLLCTVRIRCWRSLGMCEELPSGNLPDLRLLIRTTRACPDLQMTSEDNSRWQHNDTVCTLLYISVVHNNFDAPQSFRLRFFEEP